MTNPFNQTLDHTMRGKYVEVEEQNGTEYHGWLARIHHNRGSVLLHDATEPDSGRQLGTVFVRIAHAIRVLGPRKTIEYAPVCEIHESPYYNGETETVASHKRGAYRDGFTESFPVVRPHPECPAEYELINGHKRISACREVGCTHHPVEVVSATDAEARELVRLEHPSQQQPERSPATEGAEA